MWSSANSFLSVLWRRGVSICSGKLPANRRILDKLDSVRFLFIVQVIEKAQKKAQFSFCGQRKALHYEIVLRGIEPYFLHGEALVGLFSAVLKSVQSRQRRFGEF